MSCSQLIVNKVGIIKGIGGSDDTFLNKQATVCRCIPLNTIFVFFVSGLKNEWLLRTGNNASDGVAYQRPDDYDALTNIVVWERIN